MSTVVFVDFVKRFLRLFLRFVPFIMNIIDQAIEVEIKIIIIQHYTTGKY